MLWVTDLTAAEWCSLQTTFQVGEAHMSQRPAVIAAGCSCCKAKAELGISRYLLLG